jgi:DNA-binding beta-propeller fold protein YncE
VSSVSIDDQGHAWILQRPSTVRADQKSMAAPPVLEFDEAGNFIQGWGGPGQGYDWPETEHGIYVDPKGFVWLGGNGKTDHHLVKFTKDGKFVMQIGHSNQSKGNADTANLHRPADAQVYAPTNELFVADGYGNHRVIVFDADTGAFKRMWGAFGNKPEDDDHCEIVRHTNFDPPGPPQLSVVHSLRVAHDGLVYVADRENHRVQLFSNDGKFIKQNLKGSAQFANAVALSTDPDQQFLYVAAGKEIAILDRKSLDQVGSINIPGMLGGHLITTDAKGNIYIAATGQGLQKLNYQGMSAAAAK